MTERKMFGEDKQSIALPKVKLPERGITVGTIGGVFMSSVPQTPEHQIMRIKAAGKIRQHKS